VKESGSFLKKRTKKLLHFCRVVVRDSREKSFCFFFQKEVLPSFEMTNHQRSV
jgi:hypothetical protein